MHSPHQLSDAKALPQMRQCVFKLNFTISIVLPALCPDAVPNLVRPSSDILVRPSELPISLVYPKVNFLSPKEEYHLLVVAGA